MHHLIDQSQVECFLGADLLPGENHVERIGQSDSARQPLRSARAGNQSQLDLGQAEHRSGMICGDAIMTGERRLESAAETSSVYRRDDWNAKLLDRIEKHLPIPAQSFGVARGPELEKLLDIGAGDPHVGFAAHKHRRVHSGVALEPADQRDELVLYRAGQLVDRLIREIESDDGDAVSDFDREGGFPPRAYQPADRDFRGRAHCVLSTTIAKPIPPAEQTVINPNCAPRRRSCFRSVVVILAPVAPNGCPIAIEPPMTLSFARSTSPTGCEKPARSAHHFDSKPLRFDNTCAANASCISTRSMSFSVSPARLRATGAAHTGA